MPESLQFSIINLAVAPHHQGRLTQWYIAEWEPWYGAGGDGDAAADLQACGCDQPPICLIATDRDDRLLGAATLKNDDIGSAAAPGPWLGAIVVDEKHRRQGIARALIAAIEEIARNLGFQKIFTSTGIAPDRMAANGWRPIGQASSLRGDVNLYGKTIG